MLPPKCRYIAALAINSLVSPTGAGITTNVLVPPTCARTRHKRFGSTDRCTYSPRGAQTSRNTTSKTVRCAQTNEYLMSAVDLPLEGGRLDYAWLRGALVGSSAVCYSYCFIDIYIMAVETLCQAAVSQHIHPLLCI